MAGAVTAHGCGSGNWSCRSSRMKRVCRFPSVTFPLAPANGIRWNTDCSLSSPRIGAASRFANYETIVNLISRTATSKRPQGTCRLDRPKNPTGRKVTDEEIGRVNLQQNKFHGEWNYTIHPSTHRSEEHTS